MGGIILQLYSFMRPNTTDSKLQNNNQQREIGESTIIV